jgi:hypothetical protein
MAFSPVVDDAAVLEDYNRLVAASAMESNGDGTGQARKPDGGPLASMPPPQAVSFAPSFGAASSFRSAKPAAREARGSEADAGPEPAAPRSLFTSARGAGAASSRPGPTGSTAGPGRLSAVLSRFAAADSEGESAGVEGGRSGADAGAAASGGPRLFQTGNFTPLARTGGNTARGATPALLPALPAAAGTKASSSAGSSAYAAYLARSAKEDEGELEGTGAPLPAGTASGRPSLFTSATPRGRAFTGGGGRGGASASTSLFQSARSARATPFAAPSWMGAAGGGSSVAPVSAEVAARLSAVAARFAAMEAEEEWEGRGGGGAAVGAGALPQPSPPPAYKTPAYDPEIMARQANTLVGRPSGRAQGAPRDAFVPLGAVGVTPLARGGLAPRHGGATQMTRGRSRQGGPAFRLQATAGEDAGGGRGSGFATVARKVGFTPLQGMRPQGPVADVSGLARGPDGANSRRIPLGEAVLRGHVPAPYPCVLDGPTEAAAANVGPPSLPRTPARGNFLRGRMALEDISGDNAAYVVFDEAGAPCVSDGGTDPPLEEAEGGDGEASVAAAVPVFAIRGPVRARALMLSRGCMAGKADATWVVNAYRWIVLKLAQTELMARKAEEGYAAIPGVQAVASAVGHCCWDRVVGQLLLRYERMFGRAVADVTTRSALDFVHAGDTDAKCAMTLLVSRVLPPPPTPADESEAARPGTVRGHRLELTDGWYGVEAVLGDAETESLAACGRIRVGQKVRICQAAFMQPVPATEQEGGAGAGRGAKAWGSEGSSGPLAILAAGEPCGPLDTACNGVWPGRLLTHYEECLGVDTSAAPSRYALLETRDELEEGGPACKRATRLLVLRRNSLRLAAWDAKLGHERRPFFLVPLSSLRPGGGPAPALQVVLARVHTPRVQLTLPSGSRVHLTDHEAARAVAELEAKREEALNSELERLRAIHEAKVEGIERRYEARAATVANFVNEGGAGPVGAGGPLPSVPSPGASAVRPALYCTQGFSQESGTPQSGSNSASTPHPLTAEQRQAAVLARALAEDMEAERISHEKRMQSARDRFMRPQKGDEESAAPADDGADGAAANKGGRPVDAKDFVFFSTTYATVQLLDLTPVFTLQSRAWERAQSGTASLASTTYVRPQGCTLTLWRASEDDIRALVEGQTYILTGATVELALPPDGWGAPAAPNPLVDAAAARMAWPLFVSASGAPVPGIDAACPIVANPRVRLSLTKEASFVPLPDDLLYRQGDVDGLWSASVASEGTPFLALNPSLLILAAGYVQRARTLLCQAAAAAQVNGAAVAWAQGLVQLSKRGGTPTVEQQQPVETAGSTAGAGRKGKRPRVDVSRGTGTAGEFTIEDAPMEEEAVSPAAPAAKRGKGQAVRIKELSRGSAGLAASASLHEPPTPSYGLVSAHAAHDLAAAFCDDQRWEPPILLSLPRAKLSHDFDGSFILLGFGPALTQLGALASKAAGPAYDLAQLLTWDVFLMDEGGGLGLLSVKGPGSLRNAHEALLSPIARAGMPGLLGTAPLPASPHVILVALHDIGFQSTALLPVHKLEERFAGVVTGSGGGGARSGSAKLCHLHRLQWLEQSGISVKIIPHSDLVRGRWLSGGSGQAQFIQPAPTAVAAFKQLLLPWLQGAPAVHSAPPTFCLLPPLASAETASTIAEGGSLAIVHRALSAVHALLCSQMGGESKLPAALLPAPQVPLLWRMSADKRAAIRRLTDSGAVSDAAGSLSAEALLEPPPAAPAPDVVAPVGKAGDVASPLAAVVPAVPPLLSPPVVGPAIEGKRVKTEIAGAGAGFNTIAEASTSQEAAASPAHAGDVLMAAAPGLTAELDCSESARLHPAPSPSPGVAAYTLGPPIPIPAVNHCPCSVSAAAVSFLLHLPVQVSGAGGGFTSTTALVTDDVAEIVLETSIALAAGDAGSAGTLQVMSEALGLQHVGTFASGPAEFAWQAAVASWQPSGGRGGVRALSEPSVARLCAALAHLRTVASRVSPPSAIARILAFLLRHAVVCSCAQPASEEERSGEGASASHAAKKRRSDAGGLAGIGGISEAAPAPPIPATAKADSATAPAGRSLRNTAARARGIAERAGGSYNAAGMGGGSAVPTSPPVSASASCPPVLPPQPPPVLPPVPHVIATGRSMRSTPAQLAGRAESVRQASQASQRGGRASSSPPVAAVSSSASTAASGNGKGKRKRPEAEAVEPASASGSPNAGSTAGSAAAAAAPSRLVFPAAEWATFSAAIAALLRHASPRISLTLEQAADGSGAVVRGVSRRAADAS